MILFVTTVKNASPACKVTRRVREELPSEFDAVVDRLESGQSPEEIGSAMPDLGSGNTGDE